ncbi:hypothetical protein [Anaerocolumna sp.]|uniref:hypothetical protein n=1 Tax=Anaerocolumna sp. TaxID=2041569 RepID=UPI0028AFC3D9|nr:hypothetical protein [Anaerocolumna sp.]
MDTTYKSVDQEEESSGKSQIVHVMDILKAAFPYLDSDSQQSVDVFVKTGELITTVKELSQNHSVASLSVRKQSIDLEALLTNVREVCYPREREIIDVILNIFKAKNLYETYTTLSQVMASQSQGAEGFEGSEFDSDGDPSGNLGGMAGMKMDSSMMEMLTSMLSPEQKSTFENLSMMFNTMPAP